MEVDINFKRIFIFSIWEPFGADQRSPEKTCDIFNAEQNQLENKRASMKD